MLSYETSTTAATATSTNTFRYLLSPFTNALGASAALISVSLARDSIYAIARYMPSPVRPSVCPSVCPSVRHTGGSVKDV